MTTNMRMLTDGFVMQNCRMQNCIIYKKTHHSVSVTLHRRTFNDWNLLNVDLEKVNENQLDSGLNTDPRFWTWWMKREEKLDEHHPTKTEKLVSDVGLFRYD